MSDEGQFHLDGFVKKKFVKILLNYTSVLYAVTELHCSVLCLCVAYGPFFFFKEKDDLANGIFSQIIDNNWFQSRRIEVIRSMSMAAVRHLFGNRIISRKSDIPWPLRYYLPACVVTLKAKCISVDLRRNN